MGADRGIHVEVSPAEMETLQPFHVSITTFLGGFDSKRAKIEGSL
jgi:hypothetical protein